MAAKTTNANKEFEALKKSIAQLGRLRAQLNQAEKKSENLFSKFLAAAAKSPSGWEFRISEKGRTVSQGPLNKETAGILSALSGAVGRLTPGEGAVCPERVGCANVGQLGNKCFYICKTVKFG